MKHTPSANTTNRPSDSSSFQFYTFVHMKQLNLLKKESKAYGGELLKTRKGRAQGRPIDCRNSMHLVLRSSKAKGELSFLKATNKKSVQQIVDKFSKKYGVKIISLANVGNHLHFHMKVSNRYAYKAFIRAITSAIAMAIYSYKSVRRVWYQSNWR